MSLMNWLKRISAVGAVALLVGLLAPTAAHAEVGQDAPNLEAEASTLQEQGAILSIHLDVDTGEVLSYQEISEETIQPSAAQVGCSGTPVCWYGYYAPVQPYGFSGSGSTYGTWTQRGTFYSYGSSARPCWDPGSGTICSSVWVSAGGNISFSGPALGKRVDIA